MAPEGVAVAVDNSDDNNNSGNGKAKAKNTPVAPPRQRISGISLISPHEEALESQA
jgi:hypothetical protein